MGCAAHQERAVQLCFALLCSSLLCTGMCLRWFDDPLQIWLPKPVAAAESLYCVWQNRKLFCEALSLEKKVLGLKPSSLLRSSSSSGSLNTVSPQKINEDSLAYSWRLAVITLQTLSLLEGSDPFLCKGPLQRCSVSSALPGWKHPPAPCPAQ